jgi:molybdate transport system regulatory protein
VEIRVSARNKLAGTVSAIVKGAVNSEVKLSLPGERTLAAIVTNASVKELKLKKGASCCALIKSSHVLLAVNR